ncbi:MAG: 30S ribosomal protein S13 [Propionibacteriaceae bacterium]|nr:30S ribosomal protein S13 [Propionibacteriaceae bacterium]
MSIPTLTAGELAAARAKAVATRRVRAALKNKVRTGELTPVAALDEAIADPQLKLIPVVDFLKSIPRIGEKKARVLMERYSIASSRRLGGLGPHQLAGLKKEFA